MDTNEDGQYTEQAESPQQDRDNDLVGDVFELAYGELETLEEILADPDQDGFSNFAEFEWGTIPVGTAEVYIDGISTTVEFDFTEDTDGDGLWDRKERHYWENYNSDHADRNESGKEIAFANDQLFRAYASLVSDVAVRDNESFLDFDGDACTKPGNVPVPYDLDPTDPNALRFKGCSHVADDPDSDNDGFRDGKEAAPEGPGEEEVENAIGRWVSGVGWRGGSLAWSPDSECKDERDTSSGPDGASVDVICWDTGNYFNMTRPGEAPFSSEEAEDTYLLDPGYGDGLGDHLEHDWWRSLQNTTELVYNPVDDVSQTLWDYHEARAEWQTTDDQGLILEAFEIDFDGYGAQPLMDMDSDQDGLTDLQEYVAANPGYEVPQYVLDRSTPPTNSSDEWKTENEPKCLEGTVPLPYAPDSDYDGASDAEECNPSEADSLQTNPVDWDTDDDGLPDGWELEWHTALDAQPDPLLADADADLDGDGLTNRQEYCYRPVGTGGEVDRWGCDNDHPDRYYRWNPCNLDPTNPDTDGDGVPDGTEYEEGSNAANELLGTDCPASAEQAIQEALPSLNPPTGENQDLSEYNAELEGTVTGDLYTAVQENATKPIAPWEETQRILNRTQDIANAQFETLNSSLQNISSVVYESIQPRSFIQTVEEVPSMVDPIIGEAQAITEDALPLVPAVDQDSLLPRVGDLVEPLPGPDQVVGEAMETLAKAKEVPRTFDRDLTELTQEPLAAVNATLTSTVQEPPSGAAAGVSVDPVEVLKTEGVVPDLTFSLVEEVCHDALQSAVEGGCHREGTIWQTYNQYGRFQGEHLVDTSHFKAFGVSEEGNATVTQNVPIGTGYSWNVDGLDSTGADVAGCFGGTILSCDEDDIWYDRGDDLLVNITAEIEETENPSDDKPVHPTLWMKKLDPSEPLPWLVTAFALAYMEPDGNPLGAEEAPGYVTYAGVDGRATALPADGGEEKFQGDRSFENHDIPPRLKVTLDDFGLVTAASLPGPWAIDVLDPANHISVDVEFGQPPDSTQRADNKLVLGLAQYKLNATTGKEIYTKGNTTNVTALFRGTPDKISLDYNLTNETSSEIGIRHENLTTAWDVSYPAGREAAGAEIGVRRTTNVEDEVTEEIQRPSTHVGIVTTDLPSGSYERETKLVEQAGAAEERIETHTYNAAESIGEAYVRMDRWYDLNDHALADAGSRIWIKDVPETFMIDTDSLSDEHSIQASSPVSVAEVLNGASDGSCRSPTTDRNNYLFFAAPGEARQGCLNARLTGFERFDANLTSPEIGGQLELDYMRDLDSVNASLPDGVADDAWMWLDAETWVFMDASRLPGSMDLDLGATDDGPVRMDYSFLPRTPVGSLEIRGSLPNEANPGDPADLYLEATDLPNEGSGAFKLGERRMELTFSEPVGSARFGYAETEQRPDLPGQHALIAKDVTLDDPGLVVNGYLTGIRDFAFDASDADYLDVHGDVDTGGQPVTVRVDLPANIDEQERNRFDLELSELPGAFQSTFDKRQPEGSGSGDYWNIESEFASSVDELSLTGTLQDRNYDLRLQGLETTTLKLNDTRGTTTSPGGDIDPEGAVEGWFKSTQPFSVEGRIVDVGATPEDPPSPPPGMENHVIVVKDIDGWVTTSFNITGISRAEFAYEDRGEEDYEARMDYDFVNSEARSFYANFTDESTFGASTSAVFDVDALPGSLNLHVLPGVVSLNTSDPIDRGEFRFEDEANDLEAQGHIRALPTSLDARWDRSEDGLDASLLHDGGTIGAVSLEYLDTTNGDSSYALIDLSQIPAQVRLNSSADPTTIEAAIQDENGAPATMGLADIRVNRSGGPPEVPCENPDCAGEELLVGALDTPSGEADWLAVRMEGLQGLDAFLPGLNEGQGELVLTRSNTTTLHADVKTAKLDAKATLESLPASGTLSYAAASDVDGNLNNLTLSWDSQEPLERAVLDFLLKDPESDKKLFANITDLRPMNLNLTEDKLQATAGGPGVSIEKLQLGPADSLGSDDFEPPNRDDSHYVFLDNQTVEGETFVWVRVWGMESITADSRNGTFDFSVSDSPRPAEARVNQGVLEGDVYISNLPGSASLGWTADMNGTHGAFDYNAAEPIEDVHVNLTLRKGPVPPTGQEDDRPTFDLRGHLAEVPLNLGATWRADSLNLTTNGTGSLGLADLAFQNLTGPHGDAPAVQVADAREGLLVIDTVNDTVAGGETGLHPDLKQIAVKLSGLNSIDARWDEQTDPCCTNTGFEAHVTRADDVVATTPGIVQMSDQENFLEVTPSLLPTDLLPVGGRYRSYEAADGDWSWTKGRLSLNGSDSAGKTDVLVKKLGTDEAGSPIVEREASLSIETLPAGFETTYWFHKDGRFTQEPTGYTSFRYSASQAGADVTGHLFDEGLRSNVEITDLPTRLAGNVSLDKRAGWINTSGGTLGELDITIKPNDGQPYEELPEDEEGIFTRAVEDDAENDIAHVRFSHLDHLDWNLTGDGVDAGSGTLHLSHADPATKPIRLDLQEEVPSVSTEKLSARVSDLPDDWALEMNAADEELWLNYTAESRIDEFTFDWRAKDHLNTYQPDEFAKGELRNLGNGTTSLTLNTRAGAQASLSADHPPSTLNITSLRDGAWLGLNVTDLPHELAAETSSAFRTGTLTARSADGDTPEAMGALQLYRATCANVDAQGDCEEAPPVWRKEHFPDHDAIVRFEPGVPGLDPERGFAYFEGLESLRWGLADSASPDWHALRVARDASLPDPDLDVNIAGLGEQGEMDIQATVPAVPETMELMLHLANKTRAPGAPSPAPAGFTPDASVNAEDIYLQADHTGTVAFEPTVLVESPALTVNLDPKEGLPNTTLHLRGSANGQPVDGFDGTAAFGEPLEAVEFEWQYRADETEDPDDTSSYLSLGLEGAPKEMDFQAWTLPGVACPSKACSAQTGLQIPGTDTIDRLNLTFTTNGTDPGALEVDLDDLQEEIDPELREEAEDKIYWHRGKMADDGSVDADWQQVILQLTNLSDTTYIADGHNKLIEGEFPEEQDVDAYLTHLPDGSNSEVYRDHVLVKARDVTGAFHGTIEHKPEVEGHGMARIDASVSPLPGEPATDFSAYVQGDIPFPFRGHDTSSYWFEAVNVENSFDFTWESPENGPTTIHLDVDADTFKGQADLIARPGQWEGTELACERDEAQPFTLNVNRDTLGQPTGDKIGFLEFSAFTDSAHNTVDRENYFLEQVDCGPSTDNYGMHVRMVDLQMAHVLRFPEEDGEWSDIHLVFKDHPNTRELEYRKMEFEELTKAYSAGWPDEAQLHISSGWSNSWFEGSGSLPVKEGVGTLPSCACWELELLKEVDVGPINDLDLIATFAAEDSKRLAVGEWEIAQAAGRALMDGGHEVRIELSSAAEDIFSKLTAAAAGVLNYDLDGVALWDGEQPFYVDHLGESLFEHSSGNAFFEFEAPETGEFFSRSIWLDEVLIDPEDPEGPTEKVVKGRGSESFSNPYARMEFGGERLTVPGCIWAGSCD